ncbi:hypothetical protein MHBO_001503, partial [Bonamia ostreae]
MQYFHSRLSQEEQNEDKKILIKISQKILPEKRFDMTGLLQIDRISPIYPTESKFRVADKEMQNFELKKS